MKKTTEVWTLAEVRGGKIHPVSRELLAWGRELADALGAPLASVVIASKKRPPRSPAMARIRYTSPTPPNLKTSKPISKWRHWPT